MRVGIFDSGLGGLTVWQAIKNLAPELPCLYLADQAHLPYGPRSDEEIRLFCREITRQLTTQGAELIVLACNTASAAALQHLRQEFPDRLFVGMEPAVKPAALHTRSGVVGLMATQGTLKGELLRNTASRFAEHVEIIPSDCPGLAEAIEAGLPDDAMQTELERHVGPMLAAGADTIVLGCTHYPLAMTALRKLLGPDIHLIDPSPAVARRVLHLWRHAEKQGNPATRSADRFVSTGQTESLSRMLLQHFSHPAAVESWQWQNLQLQASPCPSS